MVEYMFCERKFWQHFMTALAALSSIATLVSFLSIWDITGLSPVWKEIFALAILGLGLLYAWKMMEAKDKIKLMLNPGFEVTIEKGDLFEKSGIIVIPVNEYFDTIVDDEIISPNSIHGKWINRFWRSDIAGLDSAIAEALAGRESEQCPDRKRGKIEKYGLGECISIKVPDDNNTYVLFVLTHFNQDNHAYLEHKDFPMVMDKLMKYLAHKGVDRGVYMPLFGTGLSGLNRSPQRILTFMLDAMDFKHFQLRFPQGLYIELFSLNNIDLNQIEDLFNSNLHQD